MASFLFAAVILWQSCLSSKIQYDTYYYHIILGASIFTAVPETQYVYLNDTVTFECATNVTEFLFFTTNPSVAILVGLRNLPNGGKMLSINLTAISEINGTAVTCFASNHVTEPAYVYVQGKYNNQIH